MNIGKEQRTIIVEPAKEPVPAREPATPEPRKAPAREPEKVPSDK